VRYLVEAHGGAAHAYSAGEGHGATFIVDLPVAVAHAATHSADADRRQAERDFGHPESHRLRDDIPPALVGARVLLVDDDEDTLGLLALLLESRGAEVASATSARAALETLGVFRPDVIVSDIGMPVEDGFALLKMVRALGSQKGGLTPVVALTAYATDRDRDRVLSAGFQLHISKPVDPTMLITAIAGLAGRAALTPE
jgi:CheY-like chemotaxis protein